MSSPAPVQIGPRSLQGLLGVPPRSRGLVIFAHGSGSGRLSPRNQHVAAALREQAFATLLLDLLTPTEERDRGNVFDIALLATRLGEATAWAKRQSDLAVLPVGYFGASTGAGAALVAAARAPGDVVVVVSRGGRVDLAGSALDAVRAPTLMIVGSLDTQVIDLNRIALGRLRCEKQLRIVPDAGHLFEEPGALEQVVTMTATWFARFLNRDAAG
jgi:putative phosphoribosyl transferase